MSKIILVTGTSSGFGQDAAETLARAGHRVFASMRNINGRHSDKAKALQSKNIEVLELDVSKDASVDAALKTLFQKTGGKLDVIVNNAGKAFTGISETVTADQAREMFDINVIGIQRVLRAALPQLRKNQSGLIINIGSILGRVTIPFLGLYGASKFAVEALTESYRYELSQLGIDVVLVQPGPYPTNLYSQTTGGDEGRAQEYGPIADIPKGLNSYLENLFGSNEAPNPHDVAKTLVELVATPAGKRPDRVVVGLSFGADAVNVATQPIQSGTISAMGMDGLKTLKTA